MAAPLGAAEVPAVGREGRVVREGHHRAVRPLVGVGVEVVVHVDGVDVVALDDVHDHALGVGSDLGQARVEEEQLPIGAEGVI